MKNLNRKVKLLCPNCSSCNYESDDERAKDPLHAPDDIIIRCKVCKNEFTKKELIQANAENINSAVKKVKSDAVENIKNMIEERIKSFNNN